MRYLKYYLDAFHVKGPNRSLELIKLLEKNPDISNHDMAERLYGNPKSKAFSMLKARLYTRMLETISLSINFQNNPEIKDDPDSYHTIEDQKNLFFANLLKRRGQRELALDMYERVYKSSLQRGKPETRLEALVGMGSTIKDPQLYQRTILPHIEEAKQEYLTDLDAIKHFDAHRLQRAGKTSVREEELSKLEEAFQEIESRLDDFPAPRAMYLYHLLRIDYHFQKEDFKLSRKHLASLRELFDTYPGLGSKNRLGVQYIKLAAIETMTFHYQEGYESASKAQAFFKPHRHNYLVSLIYKSFASVFLGKLDACLEEINAFEEYRNFHKEMEYDVMVYVKACILYMKGELKEAYNVLTSMNSLMHDKEGWNVGLRIFEILLLIERDLKDLVPNKLDSLRKHLSKYEVEDRMNIIYKILVMLERKNYNFALTLGEMDEEMEKLKVDLPWTPMNHEIIRFDTWFEQRV
ncbi:MAG: hypothetical protein AAFY71_15740 [Bacteroidota bacterium]